MISTFSRRFANKLCLQPFADLLEGSDADVEAHEAFSRSEVKEAMQTLWLDAGVQKAVSKGHEFALHDNLA